MMHISLSLIVLVFSKKKKNVYPYQ
jgi:hypothetical protein